MHSFIFIILLSINLPNIAAASSAALDTLQESAHLSLGKPLNRGGTTVHPINEFPAKESNRNHWDDRQEPIQYLVMHYTACDLPKTLNIFTKDIPDGRVSAHYVISQPEPDKGIPGGTVFQVVPEEKRAWHAGVSNWGQKKNLNHASIGIENVNTGFTGNFPNVTWYPFDPSQVDSLGLLSKDIVTRYNIPPYNVVGHADISPSRKQDPGPLFPWGTLHEKYGVGAWLLPEERSPEIIQEKYAPSEPFPQDVSEAFFNKYAQLYGYEVSPSTLSAFRAHFSRNQSPNCYEDSKVDQNDMLWAWGLHAKYDNKNRLSQ